MLKIHNFRYKDRTFFLHLNLKPDINVLCFYDKNDSLALERIQCDLYHIVQQNPVFYVSFRAFLLGPLLRQPVYFPFPCM